jgi:two-component system, NtrC family, response regulator AtoC
VRTKIRLPGRVLVVDDETAITNALELILRESGYEVITANDLSQATSRLIDRTFDLVITDFCLPDGNGMDLLTSIKRDTPDTEVIMMSGYGSLDTTIEAIKRGAYYYLEKPPKPDQVLTLAERALQFGAMKRENQRLKRTLASEVASFNMIGHSSSMRQTFETIRTAAPSDASVLIEGESGTGKELISTALHQHSQRSECPFIRINCAAIPHELIESELFGYKKGAFTGAGCDKRGLIEAADDGTLLLDEIGEMPVHLQTKLLRVLQDRKLRRLGDEKEIAVNFRLLSATNRDTSQLLAEGKLRKDLYFRISTIKITVPPLRERLDDLPLLVNHFLNRYSAKYQRNIRDISREALSALVRYPWPGNIRELESVIERAVLFCREDELGLDCLPEHIHQLATNSYRFVVPPYLPMEEIEREAILQTLERTSGNIRKSAQILDFPRPSFYRKLKKFGIEVEPHRRSRAKVNGHHVHCET